MHLPVILSALLIIMIAAALLATANRGTPAPTGAVLQTFAQQTQGAFHRQVAGFARVVTLQADGWPLTFKVSYRLDGPNESIASFQRLSAYGAYHPLRPFTLELMPKAVEKTGWTLRADRAPAVALGIRELDSIYIVRTTDAALALALLREPRVLAGLAAGRQPSSSLYIGPLHVGLLQRVVADRGAVALNEEEEPVTVERLLAIRDLLTALLAGLARQQVAGDPQ